MMRRKDQVLTRAMLLEEVWKYKFVPQTNLVDVHMGRLRHKVDEPNEPPMIHNVRGVGFILRAPPDFARTTTFHSALTVASAFLLCTLVLFGFVYWQTALYVMDKYDVLLVEELQVFASNTPEQLMQEIEDRLLKDPQHIKIAASSELTAGVSRATSNPSRPALRQTSRTTLRSFASMMAFVRCRKCASPRVRCQAAKIL